MLSIKSYSVHVFHNSGIQQKAKGWICSPFIYCLPSLSMEMCDQRNNITMCPLCDRTCSYWKLSSACATARASHLFDNPATVFFSVFMALWGKNAYIILEYAWSFHLTLSLTFLTQRTSRTICHQQLIICTVPFWSFCYKTVTFTFMFCTES